MRWRRYQDAKDLGAVDAADYVVRLPATGDKPVLHVVVPGSRLAAFSDVPGCWVVRITQPPALEEKETES